MAKRVRVCYVLRRGSKPFYSTRSQELFRKSLRYVILLGRMTLFYAGRKDPFGIGLDVDFFVRRPVEDVDVEVAAGQAGI